MALETRRSFNRKLLGSLMTYGLIETVFSRGLFADAVKPVVQKWLMDLNDLSKDLKDQKIKDMFQAERVPSWLRPSWPIVTSGDTILWARTFGAAAEFAASPEPGPVLRVWEENRRTIEPFETIVSSVE